MAIPRRFRVGLRNYQAASSTCAHCRLLDLRLGLAGTGNKQEADDYTAVPLTTTRRPLSDPSNFSGRVAKEVGVRGYLFDFGHPLLH